MDDLSSAFVFPKSILVPLHRDLEDPVHCHQHCLSCFVLPLINEGLFNELFHSLNKYLSSVCYAVHCFKFWGYITKQTALHSAEKEKKVNYIVYQTVMSAMEKSKARKRYRISQCWGCHV